MHEPFPADGTVGDLGRELVLHCGVPAEKESDVVNNLGGADADVTNLKTLKEAQLGILLFGPLGNTMAQHIGSIKMLLGTFQQPFVFENGDGQSSSKKKGGSTTNLGSDLPTRRPLIKDYFPPAEFDPHRIGSDERDESAIRRLIPKEVCVQSRRRRRLYPALMRPPPHPFLADSERGRHPLPEQPGEGALFHRHRTLLRAAPWEERVAGALERLEGGQRRQAQRLWG